jgi:diguanylate cyclase (GGDEF)-like protein/PAS domain S-box-containing protein
VIVGLFSALRRPSTGAVLTVVGVACATGLWLVDAAMESLVFGLGPFGQRLLSPGDHEGTERILGVALIALVVVLLYPLRERKRQAERALLASQALYRALVENVEDGVVRVGTNGVVDYASPAAARLVGLTPRQIVGLHFGAFVHPGDSSRVEASLARSMGGSPELTLLRLVGANGMVRQVRTSSRLLVQDGQPLGILAVVTDLTDRREADDRLRQLSRAVEASSSVVVITDRSGLITYANPKFTEVTGYRTDEVQGQNPRILKSGEMPPETYRTMWETIAAGREWRGEFHNRRKDGSSYWESASISAIHDETGEITHFVAVKEDITARKLAEQALVESEEKYRLLFSRQFDAAALVEDRDGRFIEVNDAFLRLFGWSHQELGEMRVEALWADGSPSVSPPPEGTTPELWCRRRDGATFAVERAAGSFSWHGRSVTCFILRDITERIHSQRLLEELSVTDGLTGLANRRAFDDQLEKEWRRAVRTRTPVALVMADLDRFKEFNDACGHLAGDECLRKVAVVIARAARRITDLSARYGGEEFAVLLSDTTYDSAATLAEALRAGVESLGISPPGTGSAGVVTLSVGVSMAFPHEGADAQDLIRTADDALYRAKRNGRNRVETDNGRPGGVQAPVLTTVLA